MAKLPNDIDQIAIVVDWLDAGRTHDLDALPDLYASQGASLECGCKGSSRHEGRAGLASYWSSRLDRCSSTAFELNGIIPTVNGVELDYLSFEGQPVRMFFTFNDQGKILHTRCAPSSDLVRQ